MGSNLVERELLLLTPQGNHCTHADLLAGLSPFACTTQQDYFMQSFLCAFQLPVPSHDNFSADRCYPHTALLSPLLLALQDIARYDCTP